MSLGYPYSYNDELTPEMAKMNRFLFLVPNSVGATTMSSSFRSGYAFKKRFNIK